MRAALIIERIRAAGGDITLVDDRIKLKVPAALQGEIVAAIKAHKDAIRRALKGGPGAAWNNEDYRVYYEERAAISEHDGGRDRPDAEAIALNATITEYLNRNPEPSEPGACAHCGRAEDGGCIVPFLAGENASTWLHQTCWPQWQQDRRDKAQEYLLANAIGGRDASN